jgi:hypothetical protein
MITVPYVYLHIRIKRIIYGGTGFIGLNTYSIERLPVRASTTGKKPFSRISEVLNYWKMVKKISSRTGNFRTVSIYES